MVNVDSALKKQLTTYVEGFIKDNPEANKLLRERQFTPSQVELAVVMALDRLHNTPPIIRRLRLDDYPLNQVIKASVINLMESQGFIDLKNSLSYTDNALQVKDTHEDGYMRYVNFFNQLIRELKEFKLNKNIEFATSPMRGV